MSASPGTGTSAASTGKGNHTEMPAGWGRCRKPVADSAHPIPAPC